MAQVINMKTAPSAAHGGSYTDVVRIDRKTKWGNPYRIGPDGDRARVIELYRRELWRRIKAGEVSLAELADLADKVLACH